MDVSTQCVGKTRGFFYDTGFKFHGYRQFDTSTGLGIGLSRKPAPGAPVSVVI